MFISKEIDLEKMKQNKNIDGFSYPKEFIYIIELNLVEFEVWDFLSYKGTISLMKGLKERYPEASLVPFAKRGANDDIACFDKENKLVYVIHDFSDNGYKNRVTYESFEVWFKQAINEMFEYINEEIQYT